ncbi:MAG: hypothetical protein R8G34_14240 [Paracoccaceae bacterium]|nr:hypothetical protein [Paracoccaceae bacterium]
MLFGPFYAKFFDYIQWNTEDYVFPLVTWVAENTSILLGPICAGGGFWLHYFAQKYLKTLPEGESEIAVSGGLHSRLKTLLDSASGKLRRTESKNVARFFCTGGKQGDFCFWPSRSQSGEKLFLYTTTMERS